MEDSIRLRVIESLPSATIRLKPSQEIQNTKFSEYLDVHGQMLPDYDGAYVVIPSVIDQTLPTNGKSMRDDMTVTAVPYYETSNDAGGITVSIMS